MSAAQAILRAAISAGRKVVKIGPVGYYIVMPPIGLFDRENLTICHANCVDVDLRYPNSVRTSEDNGWHDADSLKPLRHPEIDDMNVAFLGLYRSCTNLFGQCMRAQYNLFASIFLGA